MQYRTLGRTGLKVTPFCLGTMMFGSIPNADHDECILISHKAPDKPSFLKKRSKRLLHRCRGFILQRISKT